MGIGERIKEQRIALDMSQKELASILGVNSSIVSRIESGNRAVKQEEVAKIANALKVSVDFLIMGKRNLDPIENFITKIVNKTLEEKVKWLNLSKDLKFSQIDEKVIERLSNTAIELDIEFIWTEGNSFETWFSTDEGTYYFVSPDNNIYVLCPIKDGYLLILGAPPNSNKIVVDGEKYDLSTLFIAIDVIEDNENKKNINVFLDELDNL